MCKERQISYKALGLHAVRLALFLRQLGINSGERVLLLSENCPEWPLAYFGIALAGAVSVPLLTGFPPEQVQFIIKHSEVSAIIISKTFADKFEDLPGGLTTTGIPVILIDSIPQPDGDSGSIEQVQLPEPKPEDLATIIYTSGTSGNSKGVMLSNLNIISCVESSQYVQKFYPGDNFLSVLPLAHSYECSIGLLYPVMCGACITYLDRPPSPSVLLPAAKAVRRIRRAHPAQRRLPGRE